MVKIVRDAEEQLEMDELICLERVGNSANKGVRLAIDKGHEIKYVEISWYNF